MQSTQYPIDTILLAESSLFTQDMVQRMEILLFKYGEKTS